MAGMLALNPNDLFLRAIRAQESTLRARQSVFEDEVSRLKLSIADWHGFEIDLARRRARRISHPTRIAEAEAAELAAKLELESCHKRFVRARDDAFIVPAMVENLDARVKELRAVFNAKQDAVRELRANSQEWTADDQKEFESSIAHAKRKQAEAQARLATFKAIHYGSL